MLLEAVKALMCTEFTIRGILQDPAIFSSPTAHFSKIVVLRTGKQQWVILAQQI